MRRALLISAGLLAVAAAGLAAFSVPAAVATLAVSWLCGLGGVVLWARQISRTLARILTRANRAGAEAQKRGDALTAELAEQGVRQRQTARRIDQTRKELYKVLVWVQRTPSVTQELGRVYHRLVEHDRPMPELGDWAMSASTLVWILDRMSSASVRTIMECGSGSSTIWFATALAQRGEGGKVIALESSAAYAESTRVELAKHGLQDHALVLHAPLVDTAVPGRPNQPWFDVSVLPDLPPVDLLFVDGPIGGIARLARYPAYPLLIDRLARGAAVVLDDTGRPDEVAIVKLWKTESFHHRRLRQVGRLDRATAFVCEDA